MKMKVARYSTCFDVTLWILCICELMENLYSILGCKESATCEEIKKCYQKLALKTHPDKVASQSKEKLSDANDEFAKISFAWKILGDENLRNQYDIKWKQRCISQDWPIQDDIEIEEFEICDTPDCDEHVYTYPCRCGGLYALSETDAKIKFDIVCCDTCSLSVRILYNTN